MNSISLYRVVTTKDRIQLPLPSMILAAATPSPPPLPHPRDGGGDEPQCVQSHTRQALDCDAPAGWRAAVVVRCAGSDLRTRRLPVPVATSIVDMAGAHRRLRISIWHDDICQASSLRACCGNDSGVVVDVAGQFTPMWSGRGHICPAAWVVAKVGRCPTCPLASLLPGVEYWLM